MNALDTLSGIALILVALTLLDHLRRTDSLRVAQRTWLTIAIVFAAISTFVRWMSR